MVQEYLTAWMNWYYGNDPHPTILWDKLSDSEKQEALWKKDQIKNIIGSSKDLTLILPIYIVWLIRRVMLYLIINKEYDCSYKK